MSACPPAGPLPLYSSVIALSAPIPSFLPLPHYYCKLPARHTWRTRAQRHRGTEAEAQTHAHIIRLPYLTVSPTSRSVSAAFTSSRLPASLHQPYPYRPLEVTTSADKPPCPRRPPPTSQPTNQPSIPTLLLPPVPIEAQAQSANLVRPHQGSSDFSFGCPALPPPKKHAVSQPLDLPPIGPPPIWHSGIPPAAAHPLSNAAATATGSHLLPSTQGLYRYESVQITSRFPICFLPVLSLARRSSQPISCTRQVRLHLTTTTTTHHHHHHYDLPHFTHLISSHLYTRAAAEAFSLHSPKLSFPVSCLGLPSPLLSPLCEFPTDPASQAHRLPS
ncbi:hypothetical protein F4780DRAFT_440096 [Xylariomycetidae sp. FL0641]|nr:hypothetical protein F4780DRAFT_440096 [Xylariomycetidae sp. FL0641]